MRDIKFRAWDKIENKMWYPDAIRFDLGKPLNMKNNGIGGWVTFFEHEGLHDPIMQYTGLKDKNGKEIYEDDILRTKEGNIAIAVLCIIQDEYEIIGNIYQNQELLK